jgi:hypothetical protein
MTDSLIQCFPTSISCNPKSDVREFPDMKENSCDVFCFVTEVPHTLEMGVMNAGTTGLVVMVSVGVHSDASL